MEDSEKQCWNCLAPVSSTADFCSECGCNQVESDDNQSLQNGNSSERKTLHWVLILPILFVIPLILYSHSKAIDSGLPNQTFLSDAADTIKAASQEFPATPEDIIGLEITEDEEVPETIEDLTPAQQTEYARTNAFILAIAWLVLAGSVGIALLTAATTIGEFQWQPILRVIGVSAIVILGWLFFGFHTAFPAETWIIPSVIPKTHFSLPEAVAFGNSAESLGAIGYDLGGMTIWTDALNLAGYVALFSALIVSFTARKLTALVAMVIAVFTSLVFLPIVISWVWGMGWLDMHATDFAGGALFHWHVGVIALVMGCMMKMFRRAYTPLESDSQSGYRLQYWIPGLVLYFLAILGMNVGSTLSSEAPFVALIFQNTMTSALISAGIAASLGFALKTRPLYVWFGHGLVAGAVIVSCGADLFTLNQAMILGVVSGMFIPAAIYFLDRIGFIDPLAVFGLHGLAGGAGTLISPVFGNNPDYLSSFSGHVLLLVSVPLLSASMAFVAMLLAGSSKLLFFDKPQNAPHFGPPK